ncbi:MAG: DUF1446 domain-containing protein [Rhizobiaceae bacterium]|nr:DUF1446 domain-containing protein [Rhizobiaceae bacterium]
MKKQSIRIGGASGYWGDAQSATSQLLGEGNLDFIVYDYLAEITMSIMARARAKNPAMGYAPDFVHSALAPNLNAIADQGVKIISNAGGVNPLACARALEDVIKKAGLSLRVACITGDDLHERAEELARRGIKGMYRGETFPDAKTIASINAYTGAFAIAEALEMGADIVITGRCVDSAVTLGAGIFSHGWKPEDLDLLAAGSLAGHIIECGAQATGGNFTDWHLCADTMGNIGYPIVEVAANGELAITKPHHSGGMVTTATIGEQIIYEIDDPQNYILPDVTCDFSQVKLIQAGENRVEVTGAIGASAPQKLKTVVTWHDGFRGGQILTFYGFDAAQKAAKYADAAIERSRGILRDRNLNDFLHTSVEVLGAESQYGSQSRIIDAREVCVKIAARHEAEAGISLLLREITAMALAGPPGLCGFAGTRPRPSPVIAMFAFLLEREEISLEIHFEEKTVQFSPVISPVEKLTPTVRPKPPGDPTTEGDMVAVPLIKLAWGRSGDKGDKANIGIIAREKQYLPYIWQQLDEKAVEQWFEHFLKGNVERYFMPGMNAINFVLDQVLEGGGTASLRNDPQAKGYAQLLLAYEIKIPVEMAATLL